MSWIESHQSLGHHPKTLALATFLKCTVPAAVGYLHFLWWWALDYAQDGQLKQTSAAVLARACLWHGNVQRFWDGLVVAGFIDVTGSGPVIHDWEEYAGKLIDRRAANRQRMREARAAHSGKSVPSTSGTPGSTRVELPDLPDRTGPDRTYRTNQPDAAAAVTGRPVAGARARPRLSAEDLAKHERLLNGERQQRRQLENSLENGETTDAQP